MTELSVLILNTLVLLMNKGVILDEMGAKNEAFSCFQKAASIDPKVATSLKSKGVH